jgi:hypothetical protein
MSASSGSTASGSISSVVSNLNFSLLRRLPEYNFDYRKQTHGKSNTDASSKVGKSK